MFWGIKLDFQEYFKDIFSKINKAIGLLRKLNHILPGLHLLTICNSFIRPHIENGGVIYDKTYDTTFHQTLESI